MLSHPRRAALVLGVAGLLPFLALSGATVFLDGPPRQSAAFALLAYGAGVLAFLGAVNWGLAINAGAEGVAPSGTVLLAGVVPQLVGWVALLLSVKPGLFLLAAAVFGTLLLDVWSRRMRLAPAWWLRLRIGLSLGAGILLLIGGVFTG